MREAHYRRCTTNFCVHVFRFYGVGENFATDPLLDLFLSNRPSPGGDDAVPAFHATSTPTRSCLSLDCSEGTDGLN